MTTLKLELENKRLKRIATAYLAISMFLTYAIINPL